MIPGERQDRLRRLRLEVLVRDHLGRPASGSATTVGPGVALLDGTDAWVLVDAATARGLGPALAWAWRKGAARLNVLAGRDTGTLARRAGAFEFPIDVWHVEERVLLPAVAEPLTPPPPAPVEHLALVPVIEAGGARPIVEHGVVTGEVRGLEVCRVVTDPVTGAVRLEVGVGAHDREAFAIIHGDVPALDALRGVVDAVATHRRPGGPPHPLHRLAPERLVRSQLEDEPGRIGLAAVEPAEPPSPRPNVKDRVPCVARGRRDDGTAVVVVCSVGVDLDLIPYAADARLAASGADGGTPGGVDAGPGPTAVDTVVVVPPRDLVPMTAELAGLLREAVSLVPLAI